MLRFTSLPARAFRVFHHSFPVLLSGLALSIVAPGCGSDDSNGDSDAGDNGGNGSNTGGTNSGGTNNTGGTNNGSNSGGTGGADEVVGRFSIRLVPPSNTGGSEVPGFTSVGGKVYDGPSPEGVVWKLDSEEGGCRLLKPTVPFCDPACGVDVCVGDDKCLPNPSTKDVGDVSIEGLTSPVTLKNVGNAYSTPAGVNLPYPAFPEGGEIKLSATGGDYSAFTISGKGVAPLTLADTPFALDKTMPLVLSWEPPTMPSVSRVQVKLDISHHGGAKGKIECDVEDTGTLSISASMISTLISLGVAGFPTIAVTRSSSATTSIAPGKVELLVYSDVERPVEIPGLTSCVDDTQCPTGQTCQADLTCK